MEHFIRAIDHPKIVHKLLEVKPQSFEEAFSVAQEEEANRRLACTITQSRILDLSPLGVGVDDSTALPSQDGHSLAKEEMSLPELSPLKTKVCVLEQSMEEMPQA